MKKTRYTEEQIAFALRQAEAGTPVEQVCRKLGVSQATFFRWKKRFGGLGVGELRRLRQLEDENRKLKQLVADLSLDKAMLQDVLSKKLGRQSRLDQRGLKRSQEALGVPPEAASERPPPLAARQLVAERPPGPEVGWDEVGRGDRAEPGRGRGDHPHRAPHHRPGRGDSPPAGPPLVVAVRPEELLQVVVRPRQVGHVVAGE
jgi:putative transposase